MTYFYISSSVFVVVALLFVLWPLLRKRLDSGVVRPGSGDADHHQHDRRQVANIALYHQQFADLQQQLAAGDIVQEQFDMLQAELARNLLDDDQYLAPMAPVSKHSKPYYWLAMLGLLPLSVVLMYQALGAMPAWKLRETLQQQAYLEQQLLQGDGVAIAQQLDTLNRDLMPRLQAYVRKTPEDSDMALLLARQSMTLADYDSAIVAYQQFLTQQPDASPVMAELAQAIFLQSGNRAVPRVGMLAERALAQAPDNLMALGLAGIAAFQNARYQQAIMHWERAIALQPAAADNALALRKGIAEARSRLLAEADDAALATAPDASSAQPAAATATKGVTVAVSLAEQVPAEADHAVFIYARAWQGAKMPLAIARVTAAELPLTLTLDDSLSMAPGMTLSTVAQLELVARLSPSGTARAQAGDWQVTLGPVSAQAKASTVYPLVIGAPFVP
ncbi:MAG: c-type cytochrome biogenesis protein CcmI [Cellvibrionaceae bacterium]|nr:c-type cytochrome biogenesis protein CcmI [Cellvibrionaceae bacterium]